MKEQKFIINEVKKKKTLAGKCEEKQIPGY